MRLTQRLAAVALAVGGMLVPAAVAHAAPAGRHCVVNVTPGAAMTCYTSFTTAIAKATAGRVTDAPDDAKAALGDEELAKKLNRLGKAQSPATAPHAAAANNIVISIEYSGDGYSGSSLIVNASHTCDDYINPVEFSLSSMPSGWNDDIESFRAYANCGAKHFLDIGAELSYGGRDDGFYYYRSAFPPFLSDEISSISWS